MYPWFNLFRLGCVQYASYVNTAKNDLVEVIKKITLDPMFEVIEITHIEDRSLRRVLKKIIASSEVDIVFSGGPVYAAQQIQLGSLEHSVRKDSLEKAKRLVDEAIEWEAESHFVASGPDPGPKNRTDASSFLTESLIELCNYAKINSVKLLKITMEPFDRNITHKALIGPTREAVNISEEVTKHADNFGLTFDLSHIMQLEEQIPDAVKMASSYISHAHLANCYLMDKTHPSYGDQHVCFNFQGSEVNEKTIAQYIKALEENGVFKHRRIPVSLEVRPQHGEDPDVVLAAAKRSFLRAWQLYQQMV